MITFIHIKLLYGLLYNLGFYFPLLVAAAVNPVSPPHHDLSSLRGRRSRISKGCTGRLEGIVKPSVRVMPSLEEVHEATIRACHPRTTAIAKRLGGRFTHSSIATPRRGKFDVTVLFKSRGDHVTSMMEAKHIAS